jgi:hypothetical protein
MNIKRAKEGEEKNENNFCMSFSYRLETETVRIREKKTLTASEGPSIKFYSPTKTHTQIVIVWDVYEIVENFNFLRKINEFY